MHLHHTAIDKHHLAAHGVSQTCCAVGCSQVRSLASESARQSEDALAWYSADFREELSAFDGLLLVSVVHEVAQETVFCRDNNHDTQEVFAMQWQHPHVETSGACVHQLHSMHHPTHAVSNA